MRFFKKWRKRPKMRKWEEILFYLDGLGKQHMQLVFWKALGMGSHAQGSSGNLSCV